MSRFCVQTTINMLEIPYGDCFEINMRWDAQGHPEEGGRGVGGGARGGGGGRCLLNIRAGVKFTRSCLFRSKIESDTIKELAVTYGAWTLLAEQVATRQVKKQN